MIEYNFYIKTPVLYAEATEIVERLNELIGCTQLGLLVPAIICIGDNKSSKKLNGTQKIMVHSFGITGKRT